MCALESRKNRMENNKFFTWKITIIIYVIIAIIYHYDWAYTHIHKTKINIVSKRNCSLYLCLRKSFPMLGARVWGKSFLAWPQRHICMFCRKSVTKKINTTRANHKQSMNIIMAIPYMLRFRYVPFYFIFVVFFFVDFIAIFFLASILAERVCIVGWVHNCSAIIQQNQIMYHELWPYTYIRANANERNNNEMTTAEKRDSERVGGKKRKTSTVRYCHCRFHNKSILHMCALFLFDCLFCVSVLLHCDVEIYIINT